jgi:hypothetical protein
MLYRQAHNCVRPAGLETCVMVYGLHRSETEERQARTMMMGISFKLVTLFTWLKINYLNVYNPFTNCLRPGQVIEYKQLKYLHCSGRRGSAALPGRRQCWRRRW